MRSRDLAEKYPTSPVVALIGQHNFYLIALTNRDDSRVFRRLILHGRNLCLLSAGAGYYASTHLEHNTIHGEKTWFDSLQSDLKEPA